MHGRIDAENLKDVRHLVLSEPLAVLAAQEHERFGRAVAPHAFGFPPSLEHLDGLRGQGDHLMRLLRSLQGAPLLHPLAGDRPQGRFEIEFAPGCSAHFSGPGACQNRKLKRPGVGALALTELGHEIGDLIGRRRRVMPLGQTLPFRKEVIQMADPPGRIVAFPQSPAFAASSTASRMPWVF